MIKVTLFRAIAAICYSLFVAHAQETCEDTLVWRNSNNTCPERAVCADVFLTYQNTEDDMQCVKRRILHNCLCPGESVCPYDNPSHLLHASPLQQQYTCRTTCTLPYCNNIRRIKAVAQTTEQNSPKFGGKTFVKINCRCARHHVPNAENGMQNSVQKSSHHYSVSLKGILTEYVCSSTEVENLMSDPCETDAE